MNTEMYDMPDDENRREGRGEEKDKQVEYKKIVI
jgi:hypothetical protein